MSLVDTEHVLVVPTQLLHKLGYFQGLQKDVRRYRDALLDPDHTSYRPRKEAEQDPSFKQLIPYVIFRYVDGQGMEHLFQYTRGSGQGERRLHSKLSIGVGGHISSCDAEEDDPYDVGMRRELEEEVAIETPYTSTCVGLINDDQTEVGRVHLGIVHRFDVQRPDVRPREIDIVGACFRPLSELFQEVERMESWSRICLEELFDRQ